MRTTEGEGARLPLDAEGVRRLVDEWLDAAARRTIADGAPMPTVTADDEVAKWVGMPPGLRREVAVRLEAIHRLRSSGRRGEAADVARGLGLGRANLYRIISRMEEVGPVSGLHSGRRARAAGSATRDGFGEPWDGWISEILVHGAEASAVTIRRELLRRARDAGVAEAVPDETAVRRRTQRLRAELPSSGDPAGGDLVVERLLLEATDRWNGDREAALQAVLIADAHTRLIIGAGVGIGDEGEAALLSSAVSDAANRLEALAVAGAPIAEVIDRIRWTVTEDAGRGRLAGALMPAERRPRFLFLRRHHPRTGGASGVFSTRFLGGDVGAFRLRALPDRPADPTSTLASFGYQVREDAVYAVDLEIRRWNAARLEHIRKVGSRGRERSLDRARAIARDLRAAFLPITDEAVGDALEGVASRAGMLRG